MGSLLRVLPFVLTLFVWRWVRDRSWSSEASFALIVGGALILVPVTFLGRSLLNARPTVTRAGRVTILIHYAVMVPLGAAIIEALKLGENWPGWRIPIPPALGEALMVVTGVALLLTVVNLALRGLGAPFAISISRRLATDWMYGWCRNPMVLCTLAFLAAWGLWLRSVVFLLWVALLITPVWLLLVKIYEERELEIRFGQSYLDYKARTPMLWPRRPARR
jgi:protein-S-isoprenylcysteine O-methyltransferase Ste14